MSKKLFQLALCVVITGLILCSMTSSSGAASKPGGNDRTLSKITFIHFKKGHARPPQPGGGKDKDAGSYTYISKGARWKIAEDLILNPVCNENPDGSLDTLITQAVMAGMDEWETAGQSSLKIFGNVVIDDSVSYNDGKHRGFNTFSFGYYANPAVIAVTTVWGYFSGPLSQREIIEAHILMNDNFNWGDAAVNSLLMDVQNIATHELGHWAGMGDVYESTATEETMYGYSAEGEMKKRDLYKGDIAGITALYK